MRKNLVMVNKFLHRLGCELTRQSKNPCFDYLLDDAYKIDTCKFRKLIDSWHDECEFRENNRISHQFQYESEVVKVIEMYRKIMPDLLNHSSVELDDSDHEPCVDLLKEMFGDEPFDCDEIACSRCTHNENCEYAL